MGSPLAACLWLLASSVGAPGGVSIEEAQPGFAAAEAGLRAGDMLLAWERQASPPGHPEPARGSLATPFDLDDVEREQAPRGAVTFSGLRDAQPLRVTLSPDEWRLTARPRFDAAGLEAYENGRRLAGRGEHEAALSTWLEAARALATRGDPAGSAWLVYRAALHAAGVKGQEQRSEAALRTLWREGSAPDGVLARVRVHGAVALGAALEKRGELESAARWYEEALARVRERGAPTLVEARVLVRLGDVAQQRGDLDAADGHFRSALAIAEAQAPASLVAALVFARQGIGAAMRGRDLDAAEAQLRRALDIQERLAPRGEGAASSLANLGTVANMRGDFRAAEGFYGRALAARERRTPQGLELAPILNNLGIVAQQRGDLAAAAAYYRRALELREKLAPGSPGVAANLGNLGTVELTRGDLAAAEQHVRRALALREPLAPESLGVAFGLDTLGTIALRRGDVATAEEHVRRALAIKEKAAPDGYEVAHSLRSLAEVRRQRGDLASAAEHLRRSAAILERLASGGTEAADTAYAQGEVAFAGGHLAAAEAHFRRALEIRRDLAPGSADEAEACERLAAVERRQGAADRALVHYRCALDALDGQRGRVGGSDEVQARFGARYARFYQDALALLVKRGRAEEAFHVLERYRARGLLALLAERDLVFSADVPPELDRARRVANVEYDRALARLADPKAGPLERRREALERARIEQAAVAEKIRAASPRLGALQYPRPLDLDGGRSALDAGTLLLSYSIGERASHLFAVGPGPGDFSVAVLDVRRLGLRRQVEEFRRLLERPSPRTGALRLAAQRLSRVILAPVAGQIRRAERLLVLPDGPLHLVPFSALADPSASPRFRYLVEAKPVSVAASLTVFAELAKGRRTLAPARLVAFGAPDYSAARPEAWPPLPASRTEVEALARLYGGSSRIHLGAGATEESAKAVGKDASLLHFACHGLADPDAPLESSLVLTLPDRLDRGPDNGLLQAWEVFEQMRIDADLVTLSACRTALGRAADGEGILGLTRAFQYAGARSVLASLWQVGDDASASLMLDFYARLKGGRSKDDALRAAQVRMLRRPTSRHPSHWAAFQIIGDRQ
jgi:CHAT domain-containing protein/tetratricopeptide (TPR) repeat protein